MIAPFLPLLSTGGIVFPTSTGVLYTPPVGQNVLVIVTTIVIANNDGSARTVTLYRVPPSGTAAQANLILPAVSIPTKTTWAWSPGQGLSLPQNWSLQGVVDSGTAVTFSADGLVQQ